MISGTTFADAIFVVGLSSFDYKGANCKYNLPSSMHMANTIVVENIPEENTEFSAVTAADNDIVASELSANLSGDGGVGDVPAENGNGTMPTSQLSGADVDLNPELQDSDVGSDVNSLETEDATEATSTSRLRKFVTSAKERFDNIEPGWAQRKTS